MYLLSAVSILYFSIFIPGMRWPDEGLDLGEQFH